jgi:hypothetical protein
MKRLALVQWAAIVTLAGCGTPLPDTGTSPGWGGVSSKPGATGGGTVQQGAGGGGGVANNTGGGFGGGAFGGGDATGGGGPGGAPFCSGVDPSGILAPNGPHAPPPISGGTMTVLSDGTAAIADPDRDQIYFVDSSGNPATVPLIGGDEPGRVAEGPGQTVLVALRGAGQVVQIDRSTHMVTQRMTACSAPRGVAYDGSTQTVWVACSSGELAQLTLTGGSYKRSVSHPVDDLRDVLLFNGQLLVTTFRDAKVWSIDASGAATLYGVPSATQTSTGRHFTPQVAWRTVATSAGLVMSYQQEETTALPPSVPCMVSSYGTGGTGGQMMTNNTGDDVATVGANLVLFNGNSQSDLTGVFAKRGALPVDVAVSNDGSQIAVTYAASKQVVATLPGVMQTIQLLDEPISVAWRGQQLLVYIRDPAQVLAYEFNNAQAAVVQQQVLLSNQTVTATGHDLFHLATQNQIACASCHPEAGDDGHVWNLQEGIRRTPSLRGGLSGTEPFHWSGEEPDINTLMTDIFTVRMGGLFEDTLHVQALTDWLDLQPVRPAPTDLDAAAVQRGAATFTAMACDSCHAGAKGTDNTNRNVGTGDNFQVPRLVELAYRAPFLHDGSVPTLADRFTSLGGVSHPGSSGLTAQQVSDLVAYLKTR